jgi:hypothetical protein
VCTGNENIALHHSKPKMLQPTSHHLLVETALDVMFAPTKIVGIAKKQNNSQ